MGCAPMRSSGTNGISNQEVAYAEQGNSNLQCRPNNHCCSANVQCCTGNCEYLEYRPNKWCSRKCLPLQSSGTNVTSTEENAYAQQRNRDLSSGLGCIESRWDQLGRCDRDSECCSKQCNIFRNSAYHCKPSNQNGVSGTARTGNLGCLGREYLCISSSQCCSGLKCRQVVPMLPFSRCKP